MGLWLRLLKNSRPFIGFERTLYNPHLKNNPKSLSNHPIMRLTPLRTLKNKNVLLKATTHKKLNAQGLLRF
ncbi:hypothetical protein HPHPH24C_1137 [Helicobacter pylori Hp H-24c]|uniref:Uncharacterized protein n=1 Tax=Helicobacter pylori Hp H-24 TaxID=992039 RepID=I9S224_HELPX|nr:hypothetical protein HPHPH24_1229 [Helicobacter pylori Hp H-24]EJC16969.1 hypothetical protein HPHPH24B_1138 [Helicobacter pylori Hp H-24b]EJC18381.1 hypothetical protein HPHPH24C_1137 [Helicobacter pylori Hp H-24c]EJC42427.1 hypothetical protein HPHPM3_1227 [Helicobacter pylori Hp M3]EJC43516.1 hypothetical protein HPHPM4_1238 [Helicobacter pylori Hp M4]EJC48798.1 hypothetical protein HPHPM6_1261 [Helicobacter pylori Hp M6]EJC59679.1 hypothetical protein HPHPM9_1057 [Helicobacter pylori H